MQSRRRQNKLNNQGMSLVEVIISITILSIVVVPTLRAMTTAMAYNARARIRQEATLAGESLMEQFKGYSTTTLNSMYTNDGNGSYTFDHTTDSGKTYHVNVTLAPSGEQSLYQVENMSACSCSVTCDSSWNNGAEDDAYDDLIDNHATELIDYLTDDAGGDTPLLETGQELTEDNLNQLVSSSNILVKERILTFEVADSSVTTTVEYQYEVYGIVYWVLETEEESSSEASTEADEELRDGYSGEILDNTDMMVSKTMSSNFAKDELVIETQSEQTDITELSTRTNPDLYFFYYPNYSVSQDKIEIENNSGVDGLRCYLLKQQAGNVSDAWTSTHEASYHAYVNKTGSNSASLYHNFAQNIGGSTSTVPYAEISGFDSECDISADSLKKNRVLSYQVTLTMTDDAGNTVTTLESTRTEDYEKHPITSTTE